jgi:hypothetical protein
MKRVQVAVEVSDSFVRMLKAEVDLSGLITQGARSPMQTLTLAVLGEAMGGFEHEAAALVPPLWRDDFSVVHSLREVREVR